MSKLNNKLPVLKVKNLITTPLASLNQVKNISFEIKDGETFVVLGEMFSGKSNLINSILGNGTIESGSVYFQDTLALGEKPNLYMWNKETLEILKDFKIALKNMESSLQIYNNELDESYFKFVENKYYDVKSKQSLSYPEKKNFKITEGENIKDYDVISESKDTKLIQVDVLLEESIEIIYQIHNHYDKQKNFLHELKSEKIGQDELLQKILESVTKMEKRSHVILSNLLDVKNKLFSIEEIRSLVHAREYTSISKFYTDLMNVLKKCIKNITKIHEIIIEIEETQILVSASLSYGSERKKWQNWLNQKIDSSVDEEKLYDLVIIKELLSLPNLQEILNKNPKYQLPSPSELKELKKMINIISQDATKLLSERITVSELLNEYIDLNKSILKNEVIQKEYIDYLINQDHSLAAHFISRKPSRNKIKELLINSILNVVGLSSEYKDAFLPELSIAEKQLLVIAIAALVPNAIISLDEPFSHLDNISKVKAIKLLNKIKEKFNVTYIIAETDLEVVEILADTVAIMFNGKILELASKEEIFNNPKHPYTQSLLASRINIQNSSTLSEIKYNPLAEHHDYNIDLPKWTEISKKHFVYLNNRESAEFKKK